MRRVIRRLVGTDAVIAHVSESLAQQIDHATQAVQAQIDTRMAITHDNATHLSRQLHERVEQLETGLRRMLGEVAHENAAHLDAHLSRQLHERVAQLETGLRRMLGEVAHENAAHLDAHLSRQLHERVEQLQARLLDVLTHRMRQVVSSQKPDEFIEDILRQAFHQYGYGKTRAYTRDDLPSSLAVKQYYLQLKTLHQEIDFDEVGLSVFSQNNEDGILLYIFSQIGMLSKRCIEIGCDLSGSSVGIPEGNTINLISHFNFDGLIIDMDPDKASAIRYFFAQALPTKHFHAPSQDGRPAYCYSPAIVTDEITLDNVNDVFQAAGFTGEIDLLSIDVDGADVSIWHEIRIVDPRIVIVEVNSRLPFETVHYGQATTSTAPYETMEYQISAGSSLAAACEVGAAKGYVFVGMNATLINAFFVRRDIWPRHMPERRPEDYTQHRMNPFRLSWSRPDTRATGPSAAPPSG